MPIQRLPARAIRDQISTARLPVIPAGNLPSGSVIQVQGFQSTTPQDVLVSGTWVEVSPSYVSFTSRGNNSQIIYTCNMSYESDTTTNFNSFFQLKRRINGGSYVVIADSVRNGNCVTDSNGTGSVTYTYLDSSSSLIGQTVEYILQFNKSVAASIYFNQQSLGGQPAGTSNSCGGHIIEFVG